MKVSAETESEEQAPGGQGKEKASGKGLCAGKSPLSEAQVQLLVGLYYLPHEHGPPAQSLLQSLTWLKSHCHYVSVNGSSKKMQPQKVSICDTEWSVCVQGTQRLDERNMCGNCCDRCMASVHSVLVKVIV